MAKYKAEADGELYSKRSSVPLTPDGLQELSDYCETLRTGGCVDEVVRNAMSVLRHFYDDAVEVGPLGTVVIDGVRVCANKEDDELVHDAFGLIFDAGMIRNYRASLEKRLNSDVVGYLISRSILLGMKHERLLARANGIETYVKFAKDRERDLSREPAEVTDDAIDLLRKGISQMKLAKAVGVSPKIARRWHEEFHQKK